MKILKITGGYPPAEKQGGTAVVGHALAHALNHLGHDTKVLTTNINGDDFLPWENEWREYDGVSVFYAKASKKPVPYYSPSLVNQCRLLLEDVDLVLLASAWTWYGQKIGMLCRKFHVPYVMYAHGTLAPDRMKMQGYLKKKAWWAFIDRKLYNHAALVVAITEEEKRELRSIGVRAPIKVIPNGIEPIKRLDNPKMHIKKFLNITRNNSRIIFFLGRIEPIKGIDLAIKGFKEVAHEFPESLLVLGGPDRDGLTEKMKQLARNLGISKQVIFTGAIKGMDKWALFQGSDMLVLPSVTEVMAMVVMEALDCELPVILTQKDTWPDIKEANAGLIIDRTPEAVGEAYRKLLKYPELGREMSRNGWKMVEGKFRWPIIARQTVKACESIVNK